MTDKKVYVVFQYDGYDYVGLIGLYDTKLGAEVVRDAYHDSEEGNWYSHYVQEWDVIHGIDVRKLPRQRESV